MAASFRFLRSFATRPSLLLFAFFPFAGYFKGDARFSALPVDLTLLAAAGVSLLCLWKVVRGAKLPGLGPAAQLAFLFLCFMPAALMAVSTEYGHEKSLYLFTLTLLSAFAPMVLIQSRADVVRYMNALVMVFLLFSSDAIVSLVRGGEGAQHRLIAFGADTIALGRISGFLFLYAAVLVFAFGRAKVLSFTVMGLAGLLALFNGSRGPMLSAIVAILALLAFGRQKSRLSPLALAAYGGAFIALIAFSLSFAPDWSVARITLLLQGQLGPSELYRAEAAKAAVGIIPHAPLGLGWGGFSTQVDLWNALPRQYVHNLLLETFLEAGWLAGFAFLGTVGWSIFCAWTRSMRPSGAIAFTGIIYLFVNCLVSGDVNDNKLLFSFVALGLMAPLLDARTEPARATPSGPVPDLDVVEA